MLRFRALVATCLLVVGTITTASPASGGPTPGGLASDNVEWIRNVPFDAVTATGARIFGKYLYVTSWRNFSIYDISDPVDPQLVSTRPFGFEFENEDVDTNGKIMLFSESLPRSILHIWDVEDRSNPVEIAALAGAGDHTMSCILGCTYGYGSDGTIVDMRDPAKPEIVGDWFDAIGGVPGGAHDVTEVRNGFIITSPISDAFHYIDVRNPLKPKVLARGVHPAPGDWLFHSGHWPRAGKDRFIVQEGEGTGGPLLSYDTTGWGKDRTFDLIDTFTVPAGNYIDGHSRTQNESSHWFDPHPDFHNGGLVAAGWYSQGARIVNVSAAGKFEEVGYFIPYGAAAGGTWAAYWVTDEIIYSVDLAQGIDVLRFND
jgi:LVIVD repeat